MPRRRCEVRNNHYGLENKSAPTIEFQPCDLKPNDLTVRRCRITTILANACGMRVQSQSHGHLRSKNLKYGYLRHFINVLDNRAWLLL